MGKLFSVLKYVKGYWGYASLNIFFNILFSVFSVVSLALVMPFMDLLFKKDTADYLKVLREPVRAFSLSTDYFVSEFNRTMASFIINSGKAEALFFICIMVFVLVFFKNLFRYLAMYFVAPIRNGVVRDLRNKLLSKTLNLPLSYYSDERKGDIMSRMTSDVQEIEWSIMQTLELIFREPLTIIISLSMLISISGYLTLYVLLFLPVAGIIVAVIGKSLKRNARKSKEILGNLFNIMEETLGGLKIIKAFTGETYIKNKFDKTNQEFYNQSVKVYRKTDLTSPISEVVVVGILMLILFIGGNMVLSESGVLSAAAFIGYFAVASQIVPPIKQITQAYNNIQKGIASEERIAKILDAEINIIEKENAKTVSGFNSQIEFKNVSFAYRKGDSGYVLRKINLVIPKGKTIALVGQSGSGKTTLADMVPRFYDVDEGELLIDSVNLKDLKIKELRGLIGMVSQESILFNDTVFNNIAFGINTSSKEDVIKAAKIANAHDFIVALPDGYDTNIGDRGGKLSGGQRQRLSIARAVLKNPPILILDEATSALDTESEKLVQDALSNLMQNRTSIVIAHRLSTIANADEIIVLQYGEIAERGNHNQLIAQNGIYKKLCDMQSFK
ncbi:MAG: ATP-binding cassette domain-containing protein [Bacteroidia bacterium]|nr:ATP-binding cassette domain-containing protein [Bacteroidia bacterium]